MSMLKCNYCQQDNELNASFCEHCGRQLAERYPNESKNGSDFNSGPFLDKEHLKYLFFSAQGRINRQRIWLASILIFLLYTAAIILFAILSAIGSFLEIVGVILIIAAWVVLVIGAIMLQIKRAHDRNHSGWYILLTMIPFIGIISSIELMFIRGTSGTNYYGVDPTR